MSAFVFPRRFWNVILKAPELGKRKWRKRNIKLRTHCYKNGPARVTRVQEGAEECRGQTAVGLAQAWSWGRGGSKPQRGSTWERAPEEGFRVEKKWEPV